MRDFEEQIRDLREKTENSRRQFLETDLQTCFITIERAHLELSLGNTHEARKELAVATDGAGVIGRFLSEAPGEMADIEAKLADLRTELESLRAALGATP